MAIHIFLLSSLSTLVFYERSGALREKDTGVGSTGTLNESNRPLLCFSNEKIKNLEEGVLKLNINM